MLTLRKVGLDLAPHPSSSHVPAAIDRYLRAFEAGTLPESTCGPRIRELADTAAQLRDRRHELFELMSDVPTPPTEEELAATRATIQAPSTMAHPRHARLSSRPLRTTYG